MFAIRLEKALPVVLAAFASVLLAACGSMTTGPQRVLADGARWEEVSRAGLLTSQGVVAASDGMIYVVDFTPLEVLKQNNPGGTISRYDLNTGTTTKYMEPDGHALGLHVDRNGDLLIAQGEAATSYTYPDPGWVSGVVGFGPAGPAGGFDPVRRVLTFTSAPLERDLEIAGPIKLVLYTASTRTDTVYHSAGHPSALVLPVMDVP